MVQSISSRIPLIFWKQTPRNLKRYILNRESREILIYTPRIKICCITSIDEAKLAINYGASALGLVGKMPSGPGVISDDEICRIARAVPPPIDTFLLTSETTADKIIAHHQRTLTRTIQIVDSVPVNTYEHIRRAVPWVKLVQVIHVIDRKSVKQAEQVAQYVDGILLDSGNPNLKIKELGGTGRVHNWVLSREIKERVKIPLFLAGGLNPENVRQAIAEVQPFGLDLCSGVRSNRRLDENKLEIFMKNALNLPPDEKKGDENGF